MARILRMLQIVGAAVLFVTAGASDGGRLGLPALALWLAIGTALVGAGLVPWGRMAAAVRRRYRRKGRPCPTGYGNNPLTFSYRSRGA